MAAYIGLPSWWNSRSSTIALYFLEGINGDSHEKNEIPVKGKVVPDVKRDIQQKS